MRRAEGATADRSWIEAILRAAAAPAATAPSAVPASAAPFIDLDLSGRPLEPTSAVLLLRLLGRGLGEGPSEAEAGAEKGAGAKSGAGPGVEPKPISPVASAAADAAFAPFRWYLPPSGVGSGPAAAAAATGGGLRSLQLARTALSGLDSTGRGRRSTRPAALLGQLTRGVG